MDTLSAHDSYSIGVIFIEIALSIFRNTLIFPDDFKPFLPLIECLTEYEEFSDDKGGKRGKAGYIANCLIAMQKEQKLPSNVVLFLPKTHPCLCPCAHPIPHKS